MARSRFAEDALHTALAGAHEKAAQYVLLGAGLDTFAYRNPYPAVTVFEVDHPATQLWKRSLLESAAIAEPANVTYVSVDFQQDSLAASLAASGLDWSRLTVIAWMGVLPYLSWEAISNTLEQLSLCAEGSILLLDYGLPRWALPPLEQLAFDSLSARVAAAGEPFQSFFLPDEMHQMLAEAGWQVREDLDRDRINARYFSGRNDLLRCLGSGGHLLMALRAG